MTRKDEKRTALSLRKKGYSYQLISEELGISKSTLSNWLSGVPYTPNKKVIERVGLARANAGKAMTEIKKRSLEEARREAEREIDTVSKRDLFMLGIALYIGEGAKSSTLIRVINADPRIIALAIRWFTEICNVPQKNFLIRLHLYPDNNSATCKKFWSRSTGLPLTQFSKVVIDTRKNKKRGKRGTLPYGTAHLSVMAKGNILHGAFLRRKIDAWSRIVLEDGTQKRG